MNRTCKNPKCPNGSNIIMMCRRGTDFCCGNCEKAAAITPSFPSPKQRPKRRSAPKKKDKVKAT